MDTTRQKKIGRLIQKDMSEMFQREVKEFSLGSLVSVTVVRVTPDLGIARVYLSIFPPDRKDEVFNNIKQHASQIRFTLGQRAGKQLRVIPDLEFYIDDSLDYIDNIDRLLNE
ncbi:30S ribosome-binding factor RbfA [Marinilabilia rubra]|uniref:Ribosome-binding factor A n=1 Tax=Marinilabilia rubra TaxID=2162893 RepID=A0A2U2BBS4_9BACT|nr:30S ribosome-binding factor RbfA [Marinilabilia rubra]PWE00525.1 30S ribosome-binding factor RbfA [Marinilabilia rubra]